MPQYELRLYMSNGCGQALLGDVATFEAVDENEAKWESHRRVRRLPRYCFGALYDAAGVQIWSEGSPGVASR